MLKASLSRRLFNDEDKEEIVALLDGRYSEANKD
jgi:hypothetical protein